MTRIRRRLSRLAPFYRGSRQPRWAMASQIVTSGANFVTAIIIVRVLGLEAFGLFSICFLLIMIVRNFLNGCVLVPMSSIGPKLRPTSLPAYRGFAAVNALAFAVLSGVLMFAIVTPLGTILNIPALPELALAAALANLAANLADYIRRHHFVYEAPARAFAVDLVRFGIQVGLLLWLAAAATGVFSAQTALYAMAAGSLCGIAVGCFGFGRASWSPRLSRVLWPRHWRFIKWMTPATALEAIQGNAPIFVAGALLGETALGLIRAVQQLANILNLPFNALQQIAPSMAARAFSGGGLQALSQFLTRVAGLSAGVLLVASIAVIAAADLIMGAVFRINVADALPVFLVFCVLNLALVLRLPLIVLYQVREEPSVITAANLVGGTVSLLLSLFLISEIGPAGVPLVGIIVVASTLLVFWGAHVAHRLANPPSKAI